MRSIDIVTNIVWYPTQWHLNGTKEWIPGFLQSIYYVGVLVGATVFGQLSDIYGRKRVGTTGNMREETCIGIY